MKRLAIYALIVLAIPAIAIIPLFKMLNSRVIHEEKFSALEYCNKNRDYNDLVFLGGSRTRQHIDPAIIDSITHLKAFNLSIDAAGIVECNMLLTKYLQYHPRPRFLFLTIDLNMFDLGYSQPYITDYIDYLNDTVVKRCLSPYRLAYRSKIVQDYYKFLKFFSVNDRDKNNLLFPGKTDQSPKKAAINDGFKPQSSGWDKKTENRTTVTYHWSQGGIDLLKSMVDNCHKDSIRVIFLYSPFYLPSKYLITNYDSAFQMVSNLSKQMNIPFFDYQKLPICDSINYFGAAIHLNYKGAEIYSAYLANDIKNKILDSTSQFYEAPLTYRKLK
jgi:hypothetical protein